MANESELKQILNYLMSVDGKLERLLNLQKNSQYEQITEMKNFFEELASVTSATFLGDLPGALTKLEQKIDDFNLSGVDMLRHISLSMKDFERNLEQQLTRELKQHGEHVVTLFNSYNHQYHEKMDQLHQAVAELTVAVNNLFACVRDYDAEKFTPVLDRLEKILTLPKEDPPKTGWFGKKKGSEGS